MAILAIGACRSDFTGPGGDAEAKPGTRPYPFSPSVTALRGKLADDFLRGYAIALAENGHRGLLESIEGLGAVTDGPVPPWLLSAEDSIPSDSATISNEMTDVQLSADQATITPSMNWKGQCASQTVSPLVTGPNGPQNVSDLAQVGAESCPSSWLFPHQMREPVLSAALSSSCGLRVVASTEHSAWWYYSPLPVGPHHGTVGRISSDNQSQPSCGSDGGGGGNGGGGGPILMGHYECYYTDTYFWTGDVAVYIGSTFEGCALVYTYYFDAT